MAIRKAILNEYSEIETIEGWETLNQEEQQAVIRKSSSVLTHLDGIGKSRLAVGKDLIGIREILDPKKLFVRWVKKNFHMSIQTAYNYIGHYQASSKELPASVVEIAMKYDYKVYNKIDIIKKNPPPKTGDPKAIRNYLDNIVSIADSNGKAVYEVDPDDLLRQALQFIDSCLRKLPVNPKTRSAWIRNLIGMQMTKFGLGNEQRFSPIAIPEDFRIERGRPRKAA